MVKANAYGVGDSLVVSSLLSTGVRNFGVARVFEAEKLRRTFPNDNFDILVFHPLEQESLGSYLQNQITPVVSSFEDLKILASLDKSKLNDLKPIHLKFDLGMNRLGFDLHQQTEVQRVTEKQGLKIAGVCGHFPTAEDFGEPKGKSVDLLKDLIRVADGFGIKEEMVHAPNSGSVVKGQFKVGIRPGLIMYGFSKVDTELRGALKLTAPITGFKNVEIGQTVSYSGTWTANDKSQVAILPIGYADGLRRGLSNRINFKLNNTEFRQVGAICMDYTMVLLNKDIRVERGDEFVLFGEDLKGLYEWSDLLETIPYELLTSLGERIERRVT